MEVSNETTPLRIKVSNNPIDSTLGVIQTTAVTPSSQRAPANRMACRIVLGLVCGGMMAMIYFGGRVIKQIELNHKPPVFYIQATSPFNAGIQHGRLAKFRINDWFDTPEMRKIFAFTKTEAGSLELENLKRANGKHEGQSAKRSFCMPTLTH